MHQIVWTKDFKTEQDSNSILRNLCDSLFHPTKRRPAKPVSLKQWIREI
jgi:hypothetical protein